MARTLWAVLVEIEDRRGRKGRQLPLPAIVAIAIAAMLAGANDLRAIFRWGRRLTPEALHVVSAFATRLSVVIGDLVVEPDQNEITAALTLLTNLDLEGMIITGDAIFCQREICRVITDRKGDDLFVVKDNQPELKAAIAESFGDLSPL